MKLVVMKFGGSSVRDAVAMERVCSIIANKRESANPVVVVSAMGDTTDHLQAILDAIETNQEPTAREVAKTIRNSHFETVDALPLDDERKASCHQAVSERIERLFKLIDGMCWLGEVTDRSRDAVLAIGEGMSAPIVAAFLQSRNIEARFVRGQDVIATDDTFCSAIPNVDAVEVNCHQHLAPLLKDAIVPVVPGFVGSCNGGITTTLGRGGSDLTASLIARSLKAAGLEYWKDVDGILSADPSIVKDAQPVPYLTFREASELAVLGARVLHPASIQPAVDRGIPVSVFNTYKPDATGTSIAAELTREQLDGPIRSIAYKRNQLLVNIYSSRMLGASGFLRRVFEVFDRLELSVDLIATSEVNITVTIAPTDRVAQLSEELKEVASVGIETGLAVLSVVGETIVKLSGVGARIFGALKGLNVRLISYGGFGANLSMVVADEELPDAVRALHKEFFSTDSKRS